MPRAPQNPNEEWLVGLRAIGEFMGRSERTIRRWIATQVFPAGPLPSGHWIASKTSIRQWVMLRGQIEIEMREMRRKVRPPISSEVSDPNPPDLQP